MRLKLVYVLLACSAPLLGHTADGLSTQQVAESRCLVQTVYRDAGKPEANPAQRNAAVQSCVTFDQGIAAWLKQKSGPDYDTSSAAAQATLERLQKLAGMYLARALQLCGSSNADERSCLAQLKLNSD